MKSMKFRTFAAAAAFLAMMSAAVIHHGAVTEAVLLAGTRCIRVIIPSLYLFSILASFCIRTGLLENMAKPFDRFSRRALRMDGTLLMILVFSQLGGYPVGAQLLHQLRGRGALTPSQEQALLCVCFGCGPAFLIGTVCCRVPAHLTAIVLLSISLPNLLLALILARCGLLRRETMETPPLTLRSTDITAAVEAGAAAMLKICSMILFFAALLGIAEGGGLLAYITDRMPCRPSLAEGTLSAVLEISSITDFLQQGGSLPLAAALLSFGGICVHLQNAAICEGSFPWLRFWGCRILTAVCTWLLCTAALHLLYGGEVPAALLQPSPYTPSMTQSGTLPVLCLLVMSVLLLLRHDRLCHLVKNSQKDI